MKPTRFSKQSFVFLGLLAAFTPQSLTAQARYSAVATSSITGRVVDENGTAVQALLTAVAGPGIFRTLTGEGGTFIFRQLPAGSYAICGSATVGTWDADPLKKTKTPVDPFIDSCAAIDSFTARVSIKTGEAFTGATVTLKRGKLVTVRVNDSGKILSPSNKKADPELGIRIVGRSGLVRRVPVLSVDSGGRTHGMVIPYDEAHKLFIQSNDFDLKDEKGEDASIAPTQISVTRGGPDVNKTVNVSIKGAK